MILCSHANSKYPHAGKVFNFDGVQTTSHGETSDLWRQTSAESAISSPGTPRGTLRANSLDMDGGILGEALLVSVCSCGRFVIWTRRPHAPTQAANTAKKAITNHRSHRKHGSQQAQITIKQITNRTSTLLFQKQSRSHSNHIRAITAITLEHSQRSQTLTSANTVNHNHHSNRKHRKSQTRQSQTQKTQTWPNTNTIGAITRKTA